MDNVIKIGYSVAELTGVGTEYLVANGEPIAKFQDGNLCRTVPPVDGDAETVTAEAA